MVYKNDICPYCKTALGREAISNIQRDQQKWGALGMFLGALGMFLGLMGAAIGVYMGASA